MADDDGKKPRSPFSLFDGSNRTGDNKGRWRFSLWWLLALVIVVWLLRGLAIPGPTTINYSQFLNLAARGQVTGTVTVSATSVSGTYEANSGKHAFTATRPPSDNAAELESFLQRHHVTFTGSQPSAFANILVSWLIPILLLGVVWYFLIRRMGGGAASALNLGRNRAKIYDRKEMKTTFADVAGLDEAVQELREIVDFLKNPRKYQRLGGRIPKGVLLLGPPGCGKTLLARAVAGEANVPFFFMSGSEFVEMFVGLGAARVRDLFSQAKEKAPALVFLD